MGVRLQKFLASAGLGSRRSSEDLIRAGRVTVNGRTAELGAVVDADRDRVAVDGHEVAPERREYWLLNKPPDTVTTVRDPQGRKTVLDVVPATVRVFPVGRLDLDTTGVLLLTNDGELANRLLHPRYAVEKEYQAVVRGSVGEEVRRRLQEGVRLEDGMTSPAVVRVLDRSPAKTVVAMKIHEGRKRQVKRMLEAVGHRVIRLHRRRFGPLTDRGLPVGEARRLTSGEIAALRETTGQAVHTE